MVQVGKLRLPFANFANLDLNLSGDKSAPAPSPYKLEEAVV